MKKISKFLILIVFILITNIFYTSDAKAEENNIVEHGPYNSIYSFNEHISESNLGFFYEKPNEKNNNYFANINNVEYGPYITELSVSNLNWGFIQEKNKDKNDEEGNYYTKSMTVNINGTEYGPYYDASELKISNNHYAFRYTKNYKDYNSFINIDGTEYGPYCSILLSVSDNTIGTTYKKKEENRNSCENWTININSTEYGPYNYYNIGTMAVSDTNWGLTYQYKDDPSWFVNINNVEYGPYDEITGIMDLKINKDWGFSYKKNNENYFIINGIKHGPYSYVDHASIHKNNLSFFYTKDNKSFVFLNNTEYGPFNNFGFLEFSVGNNSSIAYKKNDKWFINANNIEYGPYDYPYIESLYIYDNKPNFIYKNEDNEWFAKIKETTYGPYNYDYINSLSISKNKSVFIYKKNGKEYIKIISDESTPKISPISIPNYTPQDLNKIDSVLSNNLKGKLLLAVEDHGKIYYVNPNDAKKYQVTLGNALNLFEKLSLGISNNDLDKIPLTTDSWTSAISNRLKGKLLLQVENHGQIWYVDFDGKKHEITRNNLMNIFTSLSLGISNENLAKIANEGVLDTDQDGLSDIDEAIYGTDINNSDSDNDGYSDNEEIKHGYNPLGKGKI